MHCISEGESEVASASSRCDFQRCEEAGDSDYRPQPESGSLLASTCDARSSFGYKKCPHRSNKMADFVRVSADAFNKRHSRLCRSLSAVYPRPRLESSNTPSPKVAPTQSMQDAESAASARTHCFFECIFLRSLPVTPAREVVDPITIETSTLLLTAPEADTAVVRTVKRSWCFVFNCSGPAQSLRPPPTCRVLTSLCSGCRSVACQTDALCDSPRVYKPQAQEGPQSESEAISYRPAARSRHAQHQWEWRPPNAIDDQSTVDEEEVTYERELLSQSRQKHQNWLGCMEPRGTGSRRQMVSFYDDSKAALHFEEAAVNWQMAEPLELSYHRVKARHVTEPLMASSDPRMSQRRARYSEPECALLAESLRLDSRHSSGASACGCDYTTDRWLLQTDPQWLPSRANPSAGWHQKQRGSLDRNCHTSVVKISNNHPQQQVERQRRQRRRRLSPADSPSASSTAVSASWSAETKSAAVEAAIAGGGFDCLLQTLERARLRLSASAHSTAPSSPAAASMCRHHRLQRQSCRFQSDTLACALDSQEAEGGNSGDPALDDADAERTEAGNRHDGNQSNAGDDCSERSFVCGSGYFNGEVGICCKANPRSDDCLAASTEILDADGSSVTQPERRETELIGTVSQSLLMLTMSLESCVRQIRGTVAELQRCSDSGST